MTGKIHALVFLGFTAVALSLSGCIVDNTSPPPPTGSCLDQRYASVAWEIEKAATGALLSCAQANASDVVLNFGPYTYHFNCDNGSDFTEVGLPPGNYATTMQLLSPSGQLLSDTGPPVTYQIFSCTPNDLPTVIFDVL